MLSMLLFSTYHGLCRRILSAPPGTTPEAAHVSAATSGDPPDKALEHLELKKVIQISSKSGYTGKN